MTKRYRVEEREYRPFRSVRDSWPCYRFTSFIKRLMIEETSHDEAG